MSGTLNKVMLIGHLGDNVKMHYFEGGGSIGRFPLATNETYTKKDTLVRKYRKPNGTTSWFVIKPLRFVKNTQARVIVFTSKGKSKHENGKTIVGMIVTVPKSMLMILPS